MLFTICDREYFAHHSYTTCTKKSPLIPNIHLLIQHCHYRLQKTSHELRPLNFYSQQSKDSIQSTVSTYSGPGFERHGVVCHDSDEEGAVVTVQVVRVSPHPQLQQHQHQVHRRLSLLLASPLLQAALQRVADRHLPERGFKYVFLKYLTYRTYLST